MPRESLDAPENLPKQALRQVAFGQPENTVPRCRMRRPPVLNSRCWRLVLLLEAPDGTYRVVDLEGKAPELREDGMKRLTPDSTWWHRLPH